MGGNSADVTFVETDPGKHGMRRPLSFVNLVRSETKENIDKKIPRYKENHPVAENGTL